MNTWDYRAEDIDGHWSSCHPRVLCQWKSAFAEIFKWLHQVKKFGPEFIQLNQCSLIQNRPHFGPVAPNAFSFSIFVVKKVLEHGGAAALKKTLHSSRDYADFIADFYAMIRLYEDAFPRILDWRDRSVAQHHMMQGFW
jgi:hypothetical protein